MPLQEQAVPEFIDTAASGRSNPATSRSPVFRYPHSSSTRSLLIQIEVWIMCPHFVGRIRLQTFWTTAVHFAVRIGQLPKDLVFRVVVEPSPTAVPRGDV